MEMKEYMKPEMEVVELLYNQTLLAGSGEDVAPGTGDQEEF